MTSLSRGFGFVSFDSAISAEKAVAHMDGFMLGSKKLKVMIKKDTPSPLEMAGAMTSLLNGFSSMQIGSGQALPISSSGHLDGSHMSMSMGPMAGLGSMGHMGAGMSQMGAHLGGMGQMGHMSGMSQMGV